MAAAVSVGLCPWQVNERYLPQLSSVLSFPQSVGIVGGRPGASLYFVGVQGGAVLYLDPHEVQEVRRQQHLHVIMIGTLLSCGGSCCGGAPAALGHTPSQAWAGRSCLWPSRCSGWLTELLRLDHTEPGACHD